MFEYTNFAVLIDQRVSVISLNRKGSMNQQQQQQFGINEYEERNEESEVHVFPERGQSDADVLSVALSSDFLIYGTASGQIEYRGLGDWSEINSYHHTHRIRSIFPNTLGTKLVFFDMQAQGYVCSPTIDTIMALAEVNPYEEGIQQDNYAIMLNQDQQKLAGPLIFADSALLDFADIGIFIIKSTHKSHHTTFEVSPDIYGGARITCAGFTQLSPIMELVAIQKGFCYQQTQTGELFRSKLATQTRLIEASELMKTAVVGYGIDGYNELNDSDRERERSQLGLREIAEDTMEARFRQCLELNQLKDT
ncbi:MAG: hypothetical protein EZS28_004329 [Streblomastix strix]|uniref:WDR19 WD40 repeat domain-containing protein n=1 Tax=Streblomastix strix TaxID=222440 RepID=A0A5J4WYG5_9EUKA|nr:MAG: hypothetical protein EZS28_004326 [Streblomastix strix]KAA6400147.1 MAG: hypothetical protein EZS28_004329 [Streblomastix strix]